MRNKLKQNKGITLIALVITIIVLLILAAVSISIVLGNNGILNKAKDARTQTKIGEEKERVQLAITDVISKKLTNNDTGNIKKSEIEDSLKKSFSVNDVEVSDRRPGEEYQYIITIGENKYGINLKNEVETVKAGILNKYIEVLEATEATPTYLFEGTVTQRGY